MLDSFLCSAENIASPPLIAALAVDLPTLYAAVLAALSGMYGSQNQHALPLSQLVLLLQVLLHC